MLFRPPLFISASPGGARTDNVDKLRLMKNVTKPATIIIGDTFISPPKKDAFDDGGSTFRLKWFMNDATPLNPKSSEIGHFFLCEFRRVLRDGDFSSGMIAVLFFSPNQFFVVEVLNSQREGTSEETWCTSISQHASQSILLASLTCARPFIALSGLLNKKPLVVLSVSPSPPLFLPLFFIVRIQGSAFSLLVDIPRKWHTHATVTAPTFFPARFLTWLLLGALLWYLTRKCVCFEYTESCLCDDQTHGL